MSRQSEAVKKWRRSNKTKMIAAFGGKCGVCEYDKCDEALEFHHIDPTEKDFSVGSIRSNCKNWADIVAELKKCVMLCANCHREYHAGIILESTIAELPRFNEDCGLLKEMRDRANRIYYCQCGNQKKKSAEFCSMACFHRTSQKVDWDSVDLLELAKTKSNVQIAKELGVSDVTIKKRMVRQLRQIETQ